MDIENILTYGISQHWFREWLGASKDQAITWINVDQILQSYQAPMNCKNLPRRYLW